MDAKAKIAKACAILEKFKVGGNLSFLLIDAYKSEVPGVKFAPDEKSTKDEQFCTFEYGGKTFELGAVNKHLAWGGDEYWSDFTLKVNGETVLTTVMTTSIGGNWTLRQVSVGQEHVTQVRLDDWMEDLQVVAERSRNRWEEVKRHLDTEGVGKQADIDLGKYG